MKPPLTEEQKLDRDFRLFIRIAFVIWLVLALFALGGLAFGMIPRQPPVCY